jgi:hypothetical protein
MGTMTGTSASSVFGMNASALQLTGPMINHLVLLEEARDVGYRDLGLTWSSRTGISTLRPW